MAAAFGNEVIYLQVPIQPLVCTCLFGQNLSCSRSSINHMIVRGKNEAEERLLREKHVGEFLKSIRTKAGLTQQELAKKLSYSTAQFISNWERGISLPPTEVLPKIIQLCNTQPRKLADVLFGFQEELLKRQKKQLLGYLQKKSGR